MDLKVIKRLEYHPLNSLDELFGWEDTHSPWLAATITLNKECKQKVNGCKILLCHDYRGGYLESVDRYVQGNIGSPGYHFFMWQHIDIFNYFSHNFITIPPACWINAAHRHDIPVLGTVITEWDKGEEICRILLECEENIELAASNLSIIASHYGFEGWLINIENSICTRQIERLVKFVKLLANKCRSLLGPRSLVIWYDSVIHPSGELEWQNGLNENNKIFLDACDGIFLNYAWTDETLRVTAEIAEGIGRQHSVYVGIDVFGRGCYGGGGFNTNKAFEFINKYNLNVALFAPSWVHEVLGEKMFLYNEIKFWNLLAMYLTTSSHNLPLWSTFCFGCGDNTYRFGKKLQTYGGLTAWHNLHCQSLQPHIHTFSDERVEWVRHTGFHGGGCLKFNISPTNSKLLLLFQCNISLKSEVKLQITYKPDISASSYICVGLGTDRGETIYLSQYELSGKYIKPLEISTTEEWVTESYLLNGEYDDDAEHVTHIKFGAYAVQPSSCYIGELKIYRESDCNSATAPLQIQKLDISDLSCYCHHKQLQVLIEWNVNSAGRQTCKELKLYDIYYQTSDIFGMKYYGSTLSTSYSLTIIVDYDISSVKLAVTSLCYHSSENMYRDLKTTTIYIKD